MGLTAPSEAAEVFLRAMDFLAVALLLGLVADSLHISSVVRVVACDGNGSCDELEYTAQASCSLIHLNLWSHLLHRANLP